MAEGTTTSLKDVEYTLNSLEDEIREFKKKTITIVIIGKSAAGKSSLIENVFDIKIPQKRLAAEPVTSKTTPYKNARHGIELLVYDTEGLLQEDKEKKKQLKNVSTATEKTADLVLFCITVSPSSRFQSDTPQMMKALQVVYGKNIWRHCLVVFTFSNLAWDLVKSEADAIKQYKDYIDEYTTLFRDELKKLNNNTDADITVDTVFNFEEHPTEQSTEHLTKRPVVVAVPAGHTPEDEVLPGIELDEEEKWIGKLYLEIIKSANRDSRMALLKYRYHTEALKAALKMIFVAPGKNIVQALKTVFDKKKSEDI